jgi:hypothetical protein
MGNKGYSKELTMAQSVYTKCDAICDVSMSASMGSISCNHTSHQSNFVAIKHTM